MHSGHVSMQPLMWKRFLSTCYQHCTANLSAGLAKRGGSRWWAQATFVELLLEQDSEDSSLEIIFVQGEKKMMRMVKDDNDYSDNSDSGDDDANTGDIATAEQ